MKQKQNPPKIPFKAKFYRFLRESCLISATLIVLIPIIFVVGSEESFHDQLPLYKAYQSNPFFQKTSDQIVAMLANNTIVNVITDESGDQSNSWQNLYQFSTYLGYYLNEKGVSTISRLIVPPQIKLPKRKKDISQEDIKQLEASYRLNQFGKVNDFKNILSKTATNIFKRLNLKAAAFEGTILLSRLKEAVEKERVWLITIDPQLMHYHSPEILDKQITAWRKERSADKFVIISKSTAGLNKKQHLHVSIKIDDLIMKSLRPDLIEIVNANFPYKINAQAFISTIFCKLNGSLRKFNLFLKSCSRTFSCYNSIHIIQSLGSKKSQKGSSTDSYRKNLQALCKSGQVSQEKEEEWEQLVEFFGFAKDQYKSDIQQNLKLYYEIGRGKKCKGIKNCNFEWLKDMQKNVASELPEINSKLGVQENEISEPRIDNPNQKVKKVKAQNKDVKKGQDEILKKKLKKKQGKNQQTLKQEIKNDKKISSSPQKQSKRPKTKPQKKKQIKRQILSSGDRQIVTKEEQEIVITKEQISNNQLKNNLNNQVDQAEIIQIANIPSIQVSLQNIIEKQNEQDRQSILLAPEAALEKQNINEEPEISVHTDEAQHSQQVPLSNTLNIEPMVNQIGQNKVEIDQAQVARQYYQQKSYVQLNEGDIYSEIIEEQTVNTIPPIQSEASQQQAQTVQIISQNS